MSFTAAIRNGAASAAAGAEFLSGIIRQNGVLDRAVDAARKVATGTTLDLAKAKADATAATVPAIDRPDPVSSLIPESVLRHKFMIGAVVLSALFILLPFKVSK